jgi:hypothetical protein
MRRRMRRALRRWGLAILLTGLLAVGWSYRHEARRKAVVLLRQRELTNLPADGGRVVYESDAEKAFGLRVRSPAEYRSDFSGKTGWYPRAWDRFPWVEMGTPDWPGGWYNGWTDKGLVFSGYLSAGSVQRWAVAQLGVQSLWDGLPGSGPKFRPAVDVVLVRVRLFEPEGLARRGALLAGTREVRIGTLRMGQYRVFAGHVVADDPSAFEFEYEEEEKRTVVRVTLTAYGQVVETRRRGP